MDNTTPELVDAAAEVADTAYKANFIEVLVNFWNLVLYPILRVLEPFKDLFSGIKTLVGLVS